MFPPPFRPAPPPPRPAPAPPQQEKPPAPHPRRAQPKGPQIPDRPEERHPLEVPEEQGRVPDRCKQPPDVGHHEDVEDDEGGPFLPPLVGAQQRPYEQHRRPRRAEQVRDDRPYPEEGAGPP